jgi:uncharacterized protein YxjI
MSQSYLISRKWSLASRFAITDEAGTPQFEVQGRMVSSRLSIATMAGVEVAAISRPAFSRQYEILAGGQRTTVRSRGFFGARFEIDTGMEQLEARGNFSGRQYTVARAGAPVAMVTQQRSLRERFAVEVNDGEDPVLMLAVILVIETIRAQRRNAASASASAGTGT